MRSCTNCLWADKCGGGKRCEYYDPLYGHAQAMKEYNDSVQERIDTYREVVEEQQNG